MTRTPAELEAIAAKLRKPESHYECEDCWYSCYKHPECCNDQRGDECTCGADKRNAERAEIADALEAVAQTVRDAVQEQARKDAEICMNEAADWKTVSDIARARKESSSHEDAALLASNRCAQAILAQFPAQAEKEKT